ncbi:MAG: HlyD family efflux transporter periplasmic adaptor subunit [Congregibacter sp.]
MANFDYHHHLFETRNAIRAPNVAKAVGWSLVFGIIFFALFLIYVPWIQTASGPGNVTALNPNDRMQEINALVPGRIQEWYVRDGSRVRMGDPIVKIVDNDPQLLERLSAEREQVMAKLTASETALEIAQIDKRRMERLFDEGLSAQREFEQARIRVEQLRSDVATAAAELTRVDVKLSRQSVQIVRAPRDGVILRVNAGDAATFISAGQVVATFVPDNAARALEMYIDGRDIALVRVGAPVRIQFEGWPVIQVSGWPSFSIGTFSGHVIAIDPSAQASGRFRILVEEDADTGVQWPDRSFVRFGSKARAWILLNQVSVGYEIWRQLNNFPPNFPTQGDPMVVPAQ